MTWLTLGACEDSGKRDILQRRAGTRCSAWPIRGVLAHGESAGAMVASREQQDGFFVGKGHGGLMFRLCCCTSNGRGEDNLVAMLVPVRGVMAMRGHGLPCP